jgi:hypothetical protein
MEAPGERDSGASSPSAANDVQHLYPLIVEAFAEVDRTLLRWMLGLPLVWFRSRASQRCRDELTARGWRVVDGVELPSE